MAALLPLFRRAAPLAAVVPDRELLGRFADARDEGAFAELVRRHGPVVYRVCRRLVGPDGAEDAFQAVFLVLATRLRAAGDAPSVAGWLVGVAGRVARQVRRAARRRARYETAAAEARADGRPDRPGDPSDQFRVLDDELARLPQTLRDPVVLCLLRGRTQDEAAAELGHTARTLRRRLERAKRVLRARLEARGVVPAVAVGLVAGAGAVSASVPPALAQRTVAVVFDFLTGGPAVAGSAPVALAKGVATTMFARKFMTAAVAAAAGLLGLGAVLAGDGPPAGTAPAAAPPATRPVARTDPPPKSAIPPTRPRIDWRRDEEAVRATLAELRREKTPAADVLLEVLCVRVPHGFCDRSGLTAEEMPGTAASELSPRERRMLLALLDAEPGARVAVQSKISTADGHVARVRNGNRVPVEMGAEPEKDGKPTAKAKAVLIDVGVSVRVTPKVTERGIQLEIEMSNSEVADSTVALGGEPALRFAPSYSEQSIKSNAVVSDGQTVLTWVRASRTSELLYVVTPHLVGTETSVAPKASGTVPPKLVQPTPLILAPGVAPPAPPIKP
jgi:RNA polymerase sigma factor (sigma-70 family)